jgi:hypothetical protein
MGSPVILAVIGKNKRESVRVALDTWQGHNLIDVRVVVPLAEHAAQLTPTGKGVSLNVASLPQLREALADAEAKARELGWLQ